MKGATAALREGMGGGNLDFSGGGAELDDETL